MVLFARVLRGGPKLFYEDRVHPQIPLDAYSYRYSTPDHFPSHERLTRWCAFCNHVGGYFARGA